MIAVIDIGTVTVRLAVAEVAGGRVLRMAKYSEICNLGVGVDVYLTPMQSSVCI